MRIEGAMQRTRNAEETRFLARLSVCCDEVEIPGVFVRQHSRTSARPRSPCQSDQGKLHPNSLSPTLQRPMDNVTLIRVVAGVLAFVVFIILLFRMKKKAPR